jgi:outer membrane murein-binding lipoprotein Lpp
MWYMQVDQLTAETQSLGAEVEELNKFQWQLQQDWRAQKNELRRLEALVRALPLFYLTRLHCR